MYDTVNKIHVLLVMTSFLATGCVSSDDSIDSSTPIENKSCSVSTGIVQISDTEHFVYLDAVDIGCIAINVRQPGFGRYDGKAPIILVTPTFFTPPSYASNFTTESPDLDTIGAIEVNLILPSRCIYATDGVELSEEVCSEGEKDQGGKLSQRAMYTAITYLIGEQADADGEYITDKFSNADTSNVGIFAFSHPGFLVNTTLANWGSLIEEVDYTVMRENPTQPLFASVELGDIQEEHGCNPYYRFIEEQEFYNGLLELDYTDIRWHGESSDPRPFWDKDNDDDIYHPNEDYRLGQRVPQLNTDEGDKNMYSIELTQALFDRLGTNFPASEIGTLEEVTDFWKGRTTLGVDFEGNPFHAYTNIKTHLPYLRQLLIFSSTQHVQSCPDAPTMHQAYNGYYYNDMWVRLNPDLDYVGYGYAMYGDGEPFGYVEQAANVDYPAVAWETASNDFGYPVGIKTDALVLGGIAEMMDRTHDNNWNNNLNSVLYE